MNKGLFFLIIFFFNFWIFGNKIFEGKIRVIGNEPHTKLVLTTKDQVDYEIVGPYKKELWDNYQYYDIKVKAKIVEKSKTKLVPSKIEVIEILNPKKD